MQAKFLVVRNGVRHEELESPLRPGADGTVQSLIEMASMVREASTNAEMRDFALQVISSCRSRDFQCANQKLFNYAKAIRYVANPPNVERIADAWETIRQQAGNCSSKTVLLASMQAALGYVPAFAVENFFGDASEHGYDHVFDLVLKPDQSWLSLDPTNEHAAVGWQAPAQQIAYWQVFGSGRPPGVKGFDWSSIINNSVNTGIQFGAQQLSQQIQASRLSKAQRNAIANDWNGYITQTLSLYRAILAKGPAGITSDDLAAAQEAFAALDTYAAQHSTVVGKQWNDPSYKTAFQSDIDLFQQWLNSSSSNTPTVGAPTSATASPASAASGGLFSSPLVWVAGGLALAAVARRG